ncbi:uncharacterized protein PV07_05360 [Cladophialophora immunda]|uniref:Cytochrome P450 n=1 Tax=Cladophialophora immunda TaxID=569365 RepID=A0A0D2CEL4_9EURO|nr:uncharacterized protein PV07_05360 [Cladophialophora immunda]KIW29548.1 hypothetical protein PV07_05360 [Cladophialophora immunda]
MAMLQAVTTLSPEAGAILLSTLVAGCLACGLVTVVIYRLFLHPLAKYPGPFFAKLTNFYDFVVGYQEHRAQHFSYLHKKYGPVVRFGPNDLSFCTPQAFVDIYGWKANVRKHDGMAATQSDPETTSTFSELHRVPALKKRKILAQGFSESALGHAEGKDGPAAFFRGRPDSLTGASEFIVDQIRIFCRCLVDPSTEPVKDMSLWLNYLAYDVMGEVVFGNGFNMMTDDKERYILPLIDNMVFSMLLGGIIPWLFKWGVIDFMFPSIYSGRVRFISEAEKKITHRLSRGHESKGDRKDFFHFLLSHRDPETGAPLSRKTLLTEGVLLVTAGSLAGTLFYLLKYPHCMKRLRQELDSVFSDVDEISTGPKLSTCVYLRACVEEGLRMAPPGPGMATRTIMEGGTEIDGEYFDEGINVGCSNWTYAYNPIYFPDPEIFRPERYVVEGSTTEDDVMRAKNSYWPFQTGVRKCPGMKLAYQELYLTIGRLVYLFDITPEKPEELEGNFEVLDHFNVKKKGPFASFKLREGRSVA